MAQFKQRPEDQQRPLLGFQERNYMLSNMLRKMDAFARARPLLDPSRFTEEEKWLSTIWIAAGEHVDEFNELPGKEALVARVNAKYDADIESFTDSDLEEANDFIAALYEFEESELNDKVAFGWLRKFLEDRLVDSIRESLTTPMTPLHISANLNNWLQTTENYRTLDSKRLAVPFPENWSENENAFIDQRRTGIEFFNIFTGGGDAARESYGLLGPYGGGKTIMAVMLTAERAALAYDTWRATGQQGSRGLSFHFTYEEDVGSLRLRALSYIAKIPKTTLAKVIKSKNLNEFSTADRLQPYEQRLFAQTLRTGGLVLGELERYRSAQQVLNHCWRIVDMTGADPDYPGRGTGLIDEVAAIVRQELEAGQREQTPVHAELVVVDYVLACIERHTEDPTILRHLIRNFPMRMKHKVAIPFNCPVWSMHQLNTEAQALPPGRLPKKTDASEGKAFAERLDFLLAIGNANRENMAVFGRLKGRRVGQMPPIPVEIDGEHATIVDMSRDYFVDERRGKIVSRAEGRTLGSVPPDNSGENTADAAAANSDDATAISRSQVGVRPPTARGAN